MSQVEEEKVFIITGASRGLGYAIALSLLTPSPSSPSGLKHNLLLTARTAAPLHAIQSEFGSDRVAVVVGDVVEEGWGKRCVDMCLEKWGRVDGVVANHGVLEPVKKVANTTPAEWRHAYNINVFSAIDLITCALPPLRRTHGTILLLSSGASTRPYTGWSVYGSTKSVLNHLAASLAHEEPLITTIALRPGVLDTDMQTEIREKWGAEMGGDVAKFVALKEEGGLLDPRVVGGAVGRLVWRVGERKELSGRFLSWDDEVLREFRE